MRLKLLEAPIGDVVDFYPPAECWFITVTHFVNAEAHGYNDPQPDYTKASKAGILYEASWLQTQLERVITTKQLLGD